MLLSTLFPYHISFCCLIFSTQFTFLSFSSALLLFFFLHLYDHTLFICCVSPPAPLPITCSHPLSTLYLRWADQIAEWIDPQEQCQGALPPVSTRCRPVHQGLLTVFYVPFVSNLFFCSFLTSESQPQSWVAKPFQWISRSYGINFVRVILASFFMTVVSCTAGFDG